jgi:archaemetzincin
MSANAIGGPGIPQGAGSISPCAEQRLGLANPHDRVGNPARTQPENPAGHAGSLFVQRDETRGLACSRGMGIHRPGRAGRALFALTCLAAGLWASRPSPATADEPCSRVPGVCAVALQPLGEVPAEQIEAAAAGLRELYGFEVVVLDPVDLSESAWYEPRHRWRAERLLPFLEELMPEGTQRILGITVEDISTTKGEHEDWGILGLGTIGGPSAVISSFRCRRHVAEVSVLERIRRVAIHEIGHTLGLEHCPTTGCFLEDAAGTVATVDGETFLCEVCRERLHWAEGE